MKFLIITHAPHGYANGKYFAYAPYVREMNIWIKYVDEVVIVAPLLQHPMTAIDMAYEHENILFKQVKSIHIQSLGSILNTIFAMPILVITVFRAMQKADHIHLRCPGNMGLVGCLLQILFPRKPKTAKYAGNWDPKSTQPWSYKLQQWLLSNTFLTKNMQVLVYGEWEGSTKNIKPFFTATYRDSDKIEMVSRSLESDIKMLFVGTLAHGKRPIYAVQLVKKLNNAGHKVMLEMYGDGKERQKIVDLIRLEKLENQITIHGNQSESVVRKAYQTSHFLILASQSEGWPKVVAEAMFWGCVPLASAVSCVPDMLAHGNRGVLLNIDIDTDLDKITAVIGDVNRYDSMAEAGIKWSRNYTFDLFESEIKKLLIPNE